MKMQIAGVEPSSEFMYVLLDQSYKELVCDFLCEGITKNILADFIDDSFIKLLATYFNLKSFRKVGRAISKIRPGKLIKFYLTNNKMFKYNYGKKYFISLDQYENFIYDLSTKLAKINQSFRDKHYEKIKTQFFENADFRAVMN